MNRHRGYAVSWLCGALATFAGARPAEAQIQPPVGWAAAIALRRADVRRAFTSRTGQANTSGARDSLVAGGS
jgi:hypothetical protein